jgi:hypothetical protein
MHLGLSNGRYGLGLMLLKSKCKKAPASLWIMVNRSMMFADSRGGKAGFLSHTGHY